MYCPDFRVSRQDGRWVASYRSATRIAISFDDRAMSKDEARELAAPLMAQAYDDWRSGRL